MTTDATPTGMFTQNTTRQLTYWIRKAPIDGPITAATPNTDDTNPWIFPRSVGL